MTNGKHWRIRRIGTYVSHEENRSIYFPHIWGLPEPALLRHCQKGKGVRVPGRIFHLQRRRESRRLCCRGIQYFAYPKAGQLCRDHSGFQHLLSLHFRPGYQKLSERPLFLSCSGYQPGRIHLSPDRP